MVKQLKKITLLSNALDINLLKNGLAAINLTTDANTADIQDAFSRIQAITETLEVDDTSLDTLQEIVTFIKNNKDSLDQLTIDSIIGLRTALDEKASLVQLAAAEGAIADLEAAVAELDGRIDIIETTLAGKAEAVHGHVAEEVEFEVDMVTVNALGGIGAGQDLNGLSVNEVLKKLLYPHVNHTVAGSSSPNGGTFEYGNVQNVTAITANVGKKSNPITSIEVFDGATSLGVKTDGVANGGTHAFTVSVPVSTNGKNFQVKATANGADGQPLTLSANTPAFTFVYPYYHGVVPAAQATLTGEDIVAMTKTVETKGNKSRTYNVTNERMVLAYPKSYGALKKIVDPHGFDNLGAFVRSEVDVVGLDGTTQVYYVYVNGASTNSNFVMRFEY